MSKTALPRLVIMFDWDNTIMFSGPFLHKVIQATADAVADTIKLKKEIPAIFTKKREFYLEEVFGLENMATIMPIFERLHEQMYDAIGMKMFPGARELLEKLHAAKTPVAIVSNFTEVGIKEHLDIRNFDYSDFVIVGVDTLGVHKPDVVPGLYALEKLHINPRREPVQILMIGDGMDSDMVFAKNLDAYLKQFHPNSSCKGMLYNASFNDNSIFSPAEIAAFIEQNNHPKAMVSYGYGRLFSTINQTMNNFISEQQLIEQRNKLHSDMRPTEIMVAGQRL